MTELVNKFQLLFYGRKISAVDKPEYRLAILYTWAFPVINGNTLFSIPTALTHEIAAFLQIM